jgi:hypothetical protein
MGGRRARTHVRDVRTVWVYRMLACLRALQAPSAENSAADRDLSDARSRKRDVYPTPISRIVPNVSGIMNALADELRAVIRLASRDPDALVGRLPLLSEFAQVQARSSTPDSLDTVLFVTGRLIPDLLRRLPAGADASAIRELFIWEESDGQRRSLKTRYFYAAKHLVDSPTDFGRRQEPRLLKTCARRFLDLDFDDKEMLWATEDEVATTFWGFQESLGVQIVFPELPVDERIHQGDLPSRDHLRLAKFTDLDTLLELQSFFSRTFPRLPVEFVTWTEITAGQLGRDLINVGGVHYNGLTDQLLSAAGSPFGQVAAPSGMPDALTDHDTDAQYSPEYSAGDLVKYDYGLFLRAPNPYDPSRQLIIINGVLTHGVLGACRAFTDPSASARNIAAISTLSPDPTSFAALIRAQVVANTVPAPRLFSDDLVAVRELLHT